MLAVDAALRNRERIGVLWQMLEQHYLLTLKGATSLSYTNERYDMMICDVMRCIASV
jgi:hypothetical protein